MNKIIVLSVATVAILTFTGCDKAEKAAEATKQATTEVAATAKDSASKAVEATKEAAANVADKAKETATKAVEATKEAASNVADKAKETADKAVEATKEAASNAVEKAKETADKAVEATKEAATKAADAATGGDDKGATLYAKCKSCHGADGKTKALGKSEVIAGQSAEDLTKKLTEYKAGTRNVAGMGTLMKGQVGAMSDEDIKALATYISNLK